jgi:sulfonate transport system permease protein
MTTTPVAASLQAAALQTSPVGAPPGRLRERQPRRSPLSHLRRSVSPIVLLAVWQLLSSAGVLDPRDLESPIHVAQRAVELVQDGTLVDATLTSLRRVGIGFAIGGLIGMVLAVLAGLWRIGEDAIDPPMQMLRTLPHFGLIPLFILWFGIGEQPKITLIAMGVAFPLYLNTFAGIRGIDKKTIEAAKSMHLTWVQRLRHVVIPGALPQTLTGLRQSLGIAWLSLIVAETISANSGLGYMINDAREFLQTDVIVVGLAVYALLGLTTDGIVRFIERRALAWRS